MSNEFVRDELWLVSSITKWSVLSILTGLIVGTGAAGFIHLLDYSIELVRSLGWLRFAMIFPGLMISMLIVRYFTHNARVDVEESIHKRSGAVSLTAIPVRLAATIITVACGGSTGKEGPCAQIGAGLMYAVSKVLKLDDYDRKRLVMVGAAAGISAVFGTPITGAIFGVEILFVGQMFYDVLLPAMIGGIVSSMTAAWWGASRLPSFVITIPELGAHMLAWSLALGLFSGVVSVLHIECLHAVDAEFKALKAPSWSKPVIGGAMLLLIALLFGTDYMGLGDEFTKLAVEGEKTPLLACALKSLAMAITFGCGGSGGVLTPTLFVGAAAGSLFARIFSLDPSVFSALGLIAVLAGATNTPIASTILAMELFGSAAAPFAGIACAVSYVVTGHRSLYPGQLITRPKARTFVRRKNAEGREEFVGRFEGVSLLRIVRFYFDILRNQYIKGIRR